MEVGRRDIAREARIGHGVVEDVGLGIVCRLERSRPGRVVGRDFLGAGQHCGQVHLGGEGGERRAGEGKADQGGKDNEGKSSHGCLLG